MPTRPVTVVFVHGWSVTHTNTYGELPERLRAEAAAAGIDLKIQEVFLGRYISFHDEVRLEDISRAFRDAVRDALGSGARSGGRFACITHSTGGPVIRDWWKRYHAEAPGRPACPLSHLIMLAPANFGSALAQLGKARISRMKSWFEGVDPGQGVLDWLELGSPEAWELNQDWTRNDGGDIGPKGVFPFVLTGQSIDRKFYDNLNTYTGELGSDGVVRVASANLNSRYLRLDQETPRKGPGGRGPDFVASGLQLTAESTAPVTPLRVLRGRSHSGTRMGIMRSVKGKRSDAASEETVDAILRCLRVKTLPQYRQLAEAFEAETQQVQEDERLETETKLLLFDRHFLHDRFSQVIFRVRDLEGHPVTDFDLILTAGPDANPNHLPGGFFQDRQRNSRSRETLTYYLNHDVMQGCEEIRDADGDLVRPALPGAEMLGFRILPRPAEGFVHHLPCEVKASRELLSRAVQANRSTLIDIRLQRVVRKNVFRLDRGEGSRGSFKRLSPGDEIVE